MAKEVKLPQLGQTMEEGTIVNCLVKIGSPVKKGDVIFEIETDKATLEMESPADGFVKHILVTVGQTLPIGTTMMILGGEDEKIEVAKVTPVVSQSAPAVQAPAPEPAKQQMPAQTTAKIMASPRASIWRRLPAQGLRAKSPRKTLKMPLRKKKPNQQKSPRKSNSATQYPLRKNSESPHKEWSNQNGKSPAFT
jgi:pyruvate dehydrogenase E2 component (dihydrolipoamide acetyltransferase)